MTDFRTIRAEITAEKAAILELETKTKEQFERMCYLTNCVIHLDFCVDRQLGGKQWKTYERRTGRNTLEFTPDAYQA